MVSLKKVCYLLPAVVICLIYGVLLHATRTPLGEMLSFFTGVAGLYLLLPIVGSVLLLKGNWWGCLFGVAMGLMLIYQDMNDYTMQHIDVEIPLGIAFLAYYTFAGFLCKKEK